MEQSWVDESPGAAQSFLSNNENKLKMWGKKKIKALLKVETLFTIQVEKEKMHFMNSTSVQDPVAHCAEFPGNKAHIPMFTVNKMFAKSQVKKDLSFTEFRNVNMKTWMKKEQGEWVINTSLPFSSHFLRKILNVEAHFRNRILIFLLIILPICQFGTIVCTQDYQLGNFSFQCRTKLTKGKKKSLFGLMILSEILSSKFLLRVSN